jgi:hypothetical protein
VAPYPNHWLGPFLTSRVIFWGEDRILWSLASSNYSVVYIHCAHQLPERESTCFELALVVQSLPRTSSAVSLSRKVFVSMWRADLRAGFYSAQLSVLCYRGFLAAIFLRVHVARLITRWRAPRVWSTRISSFTSATDIFRAISGRMTVYGLQTLGQVRFT